MERTPVESTQVRSLGYDPKNWTLEVEYLNGGEIFRYFGVSPQKYRALIESNSIGGYVSDKIKGRYRYREVSK